MTDNNNDYSAFNINLDGLFSQLSEILVNPAFSNSACSFLLLLWGYFEIAIDESDERAARATTTPNIIQIEKGYEIFDYGTYLKTSPGKHYGSYTTGQLLTTVKAMIDLLIKRGAKRVRFSGLPAAERAAWFECKKYDLNTHFEADEKTKLLRERLSELDRFREVVYSLSAKK